MDHNVIAFLTENDRWKAWLPYKDPVKGLRILTGYGRTIEEAALNAYKELKEWLHG